MLFALCLTFILRGVIPSKNFPKGIWLALSCGGVILLLLILTWIPSVAKPNLSSRCSAEPSQWVKGWADVATGLTVLLVAVYFATISVLMFRLRKSRRLSRDRRTVMKHGIFHLVLGSILYVSIFFLPLIRHTLVLNILTSYLHCHSTYLLYAFGLHKLLD